MTESDFFRTRITHSLEVAQIGRVLAHYYGVPTAIVSAACLAHDIGHPPFGHSGEETLNHIAMQWSENAINFEGNAQTFRILSYLDRSYEESPGFGLDLTCATLDAVLKYKRVFEPAEASLELAKGHAFKCYYREDSGTVSEVVRWTGTGRKRSPLVMFVETADDIAYATHDLEDGIRAGFLTDKKIIAGVEKLLDGSSRVGKRWRRRLNELRKYLVSSRNSPNQLDPNAFKRWKRALVDAFVVEAVSVKPSVVRKMRTLAYSEELRENLLVSESEGMLVVLEGLKQIVRDGIISNPQLQYAQSCAKAILEDYFRIYRPAIMARSQNDQRLLGGLPKSLVDQFARVDHEDGRLRLFLDYVSGMTDEYLVSRYCMLKGIRHPTAFTVPS